MAEPTSQTSCPRCGYDLTGVRAARSPNGTCSECGLGFSWVELESGRMHSPRFSFEHAEGLGLLAFLRTIGRSIIGWRLWGPLRMEHGIRPMRLVVFVLLMIVPAHVLAASAVVFAAWSPRMFVYGWQPRSWALANYSKTGVVSYPPPLPGSIVLWTDRGGEVVLSDLVPLVVWPYDHSISFAPSGWRFGSPFSTEVLLGAASGMLGTPLVFVLLRQTRRKFRLRKLHLLRAACLCLPAIVATVLLGWGAMIVVQKLFPWNRPKGPALLAAALVCFAYQTFWWWAFAGRYLRAPHALGIAASGVIIGGLVFAIASLASGSRLLYG